MKSKKEFVSSLLAIVFLFVATVDPVFAKLNRNTAMLQATNSLVKHKASSEIWSRLRGRLDLSAGKNSPIYKKHLRNYARSQDYINKVARNATPYLYYILEEVEKRGMPSEIALLPIIESDFNPHTRSNKGALGLWQIMPSLGRLHGLKQNASYDGRKDIYESTKVALDHLAHLHKKFDGNWLLAIAAYNCGEGALTRAISKNRRARISTDFWSLPLPKQTKDFVPKLLALATIIKSPANYGLVLPSIPNQAVITRVKMSQPIDIQHAAKMVEISETQLRRLNPGHKSSAAKISMHLVVPIQKASLVKAAVPNVKTETSKEKPNESKPKAKKSAKQKSKTKAAKKHSKTKTKKQQLAKKSNSNVKKAKRARRDPYAAYANDPRMENFLKYQSGRY